MPRTLSSSGTCGFNQTRSHLSSPKRKKLLGLRGSLQRLLLCGAEGIHQGHQPLLWHINKWLTVVAAAIGLKDSPCCGEAGQFEHGRLFHRVERGCRS